MDGSAGWTAPRGLGILFVVVGHLLRGLRPAGILGDTAGNRFADAWIYAFHMPLFFILSGLFAERKIGRDARTFLVEQATTIAYPYLLWSALQTGLQIALSGTVNACTTC